MAAVETYLYSNCSSCKKAESALLDANVEFDRRDIFRQKLTPAEIRELLEKLKLSAFDVLSTRSIPYRELGLANCAVTEIELIELMSEHPGLLKRPIIIAGDNHRIGFNKTAIDELIAGLKKELFDVT